MSCRASISTTDKCECIVMDLSREYVRCNLCDSDSFITKFIGKDRSHNLPGDWTVVECSVCGLIYVNPRPTTQSLSLYYPQTYWDALDKPLVRTIETLNAILLRPIRYKISIPKRTNGKLLDIGCGVGRFLASMKQRGWEAYGVEPGSAACERAERNEGLNVFNGTLEDASFPNDFF